VQEKKLDVCIEKLISAEHSVSVRCRWRDCD